MLYPKAHSWEVVEPGFQCSDVEEARAEESIGT